LNCKFAGNLPSADDDRKLILKLVGEKYNE
jgi:hypothetical protein